MFIFSPLEQFSINRFIPIFIGNFDFSITNSTVLVIISTTVAFLFYNFACSNAKLLPSAWQSTAEFIYEFIYFTVLSENVKKNGPLYFPMLFTIFSFIFFCNLLGMIPFSFTVTSHIGVKTHGFHMLSLFLPPGAPIALAPLLVMIELVSYSFRVVSLALRLFANMMSGHCLLKILAGFAWTMLGAGGILSIAHFLPLLVIFAIVGLELSIAFLQAYVFTVLLCIYLNDAISLH
jgi:F0F1-type ATP synthase membrane subunit a